MSTISPALSSVKRKSFSEQIASEDAANQILKSIRDLRIALLRFPASDRQRRTIETAGAVLHSFVEMLRAVSILPKPADREVER